MEATKKRILIVTGVYPPEIGGPATYTKLLEEELPERGYEVEVLPFKVVRHLPKLIRHFVFTFKIIKQAKSVDIIFAQDSVSVGLPALIASKFLGKVFCLRIPGDYAWEQASQSFGVTDSLNDFQFKKYNFKIELLKSIQRFVVCHAGFTITPSDYFSGIVRQWVKHPEFVFTVHNGINIEDTLLSKDILNFESKSIISAGRLLSLKGFDMLIKAIKCLPEWKLYVAGEGPERVVLENLIKKERVSDRVILMGQIPRQELLKKISQCKIFALNTQFESFSFQTLEAMALGTPVIVTKVGGLREIVEENKSGIFITPDDQEAFLQAVKKLSEDNDFCNDIIIGGQRRALDFSIDFTISSLVNHINTI